MLRKENKNKNTKNLKNYKGFSIKKEWIRGLGEETYTASKKSIVLECDSLKEIKRLIDELAS